MGVPITDLTPAQALADAELISYWHVTWWLHQYNYVGHPSRRLEILPNNGAAPVTDPILGAPKMVSYWHKHWHIAGQISYWQ